MEQRRDRIRDLKPFLVDFLTMEGVELDRSRQGRCLLCGSGEGDKAAGHDGAFTVKADLQTWKCFSCDKGGDIVDLAGALWNMKRADTIEQLADIFLGGKGAAGLPAGPMTARARETRPKAQAEVVEPKPYTYDLERACGMLWSTAGARVLSYLRGRGLADDVLRKHRVGAWRINGRTRACFPYLDDNGNWTGALFWRAVDAAEGDRVTRGYASGRGYSKHPFVYGTGAFDRAMAARQPVFVTEAQIDALSVETLGFHAVSTSSTGGVDHFLQCLEAPRALPMLCLMLDNDHKGRQAQDKLMAGLDELGLPYLSFYWGDSDAGYDLTAYKDPNEALQRDRDGLEKALQAAVEALDDETRTETREEPDMSAERQQDAQKKASFISLGEQLDDLVSEFANRPDPMSTGIPALDRILYGGLARESLYLLGAMPGAGKSALALQIADNVASNGGRVLYYSVEMTPIELVERSLCRLSLESVWCVRDAFKKPLGAKLEVTKAREEYRETIAKNLFVVSPDDITIEQIKQDVENFCAAYEGEKLIVVDYLQLIKIDDPKLNRDTLTRLSAVSRTLKILSKLAPVLVVSSLSRAGYDNQGGPGIDSFRGSGELEFSANVAMVLHEDKNDKAAGRCKSMVLEIVKARGLPLGTARLDFDGEHYTFQDAVEDVAKVEYAQPVSRGRGSRFK